MPHAGAETRVDTVRVVMPGCLGAGGGRKKAWTYRGMAADDRAPRGRACGGVGTLRAARARPPSVLIFNTRWDEAAQPPGFGVPLVCYPVTPATVL